MRGRTIVWVVGLILLGAIGVLWGLNQMGPKPDEIKDIKILPEIKCAAEAVTGIKAEARVSFSVKASASAKGEAKSG